MILQDLPGGDIPLLTALALIQSLLSLSQAKKFYGLTRTQLHICTALLCREAMNMTQLADFVSTSKEQATRAVAPLADEGVVERFEIPEKRTHVYVRLTKSGRQHVQKCLAELQGGAVQKLAASTTPEERETLNRALYTVIDILNKGNK